MSIPATQSVAFGSKTRRGHGGHKLGYTGTGTLAITAGNGAGHWGIRSNELVPAWTETVPPGTGAYGSAPPTFTGPYTLTIGDGTESSTVTVNLVANKATIAPATADTASGHQLQQLITSGMIQLGDEIVLRSGDYNPTQALWQVTKNAQFTQRSGGPAAPAALADAGWVTVRPETPYGARIPGYYLSGQTVAAQYLKFDQIDFFRPCLTAANATSFAPLMNVTASAISHIAATRCRFRSQMHPGQSIADLGGVDGIHDGIRLLSIPANIGFVSNIWIDDCEFSDLFEAIRVCGNAYTATNLRFSNIWGDCINGLPLGGSTFDGLFVTNRKSPDSAASPAYHPDVVQVHSDSTLPAGTYAGPKFSNIVMHRGLGTNGETEGQGIFFSTVRTTSDVWFTGVEVTNALFVGTPQRGISLQACINPLVARCTVLKDVAANGGSIVANQHPTIALDRCDGGRISRNLVHRQAAVPNPIVVTNPVNAPTIDADNVYVQASEYAATFAGPVYGADAGTRAAVVAGFKPKTTGAANLSGAYSGALNADGSLTVGGVMLPYSLVHDFEAVGTAAFSGGEVPTLHMGARKVLHTAGLRLVGNGATSTALNTISVVNDDMASWDTLVIEVDLGNFPESALGSLRPRFNNGATVWSYYWDSAGGVSTPYNQPFTSDSRGRRWLPFKIENFKVGSFAGASVKSAGAVAKTFAIPIATTGSGGLDVVVDAAVRPAIHKSSVMLTFDDAPGNQYSLAFSTLQSREIPASLYVPFNFIDVGGNLTSANIDTMRAAGWATCVDSDANDRPFTSYATRAAAIAAINANRDAILARWGDTEGVKHFCTSYSRLGYPIAKVTSAVTANGTDEITCAVAYASGAAGMRVTGANVPPGTFVVSCPAQNKLKLNQAVPASVTSINLLARSQGVAVTCVGTTSITNLASTADLFVGQTMMGYTVPSGTRIVGIDSATAITVSAAIPATCNKASFGYVDGEFWHTKLQDDLIANGYRSGRAYAGGASGFYTGYGIDPLAAIQLPAISMDSTSAVSVITANINALVAERCDIILYAHNIVDAHFTQVADLIQNLRNDGTIEALTVPAWYDKVAARLPIS